jgi:hypothetical protein
MTMPFGLQPGLDTLWTLVEMAVVSFGFKEPKNINESAE